MSDKDEALRLANSLAAHSLSRHGQTQAAAELRRLYAECEALRAENEHLRKTAHEHVSRALYDAHTAELRAEADALRTELLEVIEAMNDPAVKNIRTPVASIRILQAECNALRVELDAMTNRAREAENDRQDVFDSYTDACNQLVETEAKCDALRAAGKRVLEAYDNCDKWKMVVAIDDTLRAAIDAAREAGK